jgi:hypothetical protein
VKIITWVLGIVAGIVTLLSVAFLAPRFHLPRAEYKFLSGSTSFNGTLFADVRELRDRGWVVDDLSMDSCGNISIMMRKDP